MKRFGSVFPFIEHAHTDVRIGRLVANHDFVRALLHHAAFDEFVFSGPSVGSLAAFGRLLDDWGLPPDRRRAVRLVTLADIPALLASTTFHVFHLGGWGYFMPGLHALRAAYACSPWPITGLIHSLHGREVVDHAVRVTAARMASCDAIICTSRDGRRAMEGLLAHAAGVTGSAFAGQLPLLPLGVDDELCDRAGHGARARRRLEIPDEAHVVLTLGRLTPALKMDLAPLLRAFRTLVLPHCRRPVVLVLAGGAQPGDVELLRRLVASYGLEAVTRIHPNFSSSVKADLLDAAHLVVSLADNTQETFGISLLEAQARAVPVVASRFSGYKDTIVDGVDGVLVDTYWHEDLPFNDIEELFDPTVCQLHQAQTVAVDLEQTARAILSLLNDEPTRQAMGARGRDKVDRRYRWSRLIREYEQMWDGLAVEAARGALVGSGSRGHARPQARAFAHYASRPLDPSTSLVVGPIQELDPPYDEIAPYVARPIVERILERAREPLTIDGLARETGVPPPRLWFVLLWLLKYGVLRVVSSHVPAEGRL